MFLDRILLSLAQWFCNKFQRFTGFTKFRLQKWALLLSFLFLLAAVSAEPHVMLIVMMMTQAFMVKSVVRDIEKEETTFLQDGGIRLSAWHIRPLRALVLVISCLTSIILMMSALDMFARLFICSQVCVVAWVYFSACIPRLPSKSKMREWLEKGLTALRDSLPPAPIPISNR